MSFTAGSFYQLSPPLLHHSPDYARQGSSCCCLGVVTTVLQSAWWSKRAVLRLFQARLVDFDLPIIQEYHSVFVGFCSVRRSKHLLGFPLQHHELCKRFFCFSRSQAWVQWQQAGDCSHLERSSEGPRLLATRRLWHHSGNVSPSYSSPPANFIQIPVAAPDQVPRGMTGQKAEQFKNLSISMFISPKQGPSLTAPQHRELPPTSKSSPRRCGISMPKE